MNESFVFYASFYEAISELDPEDQLACYNAITRYALFGEEPQSGGIVKAVFKLVKPNIDANQKKREAGRKGGEAKAKQDESTAEAETKQTGSKREAQRSKSVANTKQNEAHYEKVPSNEDEDEDVNEDKKKRVEKKSRFAPPSLEEVTEYCRERNNNVDPQQFVDFYSSKGWKVGNQPMKDWKACVRTWERREKTRAGTRGKPNPFNQMMQTDYDMKSIEEAILA